jgi:DNA polymerase-1
MPVSSFENPTSGEETRPRLLLIDGHSMAFRAFYALPETMTTTTGQPVNAVYGFMSMLTRLLENEAPTHVAVAFDLARDSFRTERFPSYKGTRKPTPEGFKGQVPLIKEVLGTLNIPALELAGYEADDILATLSAQGEAAGMEVLICSGDRDTLQLVTDNVTVLYPIRGVSELARMTPDAVLTKYGVGPQQYPDLAALVGESSDNIPGVPGVGPKTAVKWISQFGSLVGLLDQNDQIPGKVGEALRAHTEQVRLNREINALLRDVDLPIAPLDAARAPFDIAAVHQLADSLQWGGLRDRILALNPMRNEPEAIASLPHSTPVLVEPLKPGELEKWLTELGEGAAALALAGSGSEGNGDAWGLAIVSPTNDAQRSGVYLDLVDLGLEDESALATWLSDERVAKIMHGAKAGAHALRSRGFTLNGVSFDTELAAYLCFPDRKNLGLNEISEQLLHRHVSVAAASHGTFDFGDQAEFGVTSAGVDLINQAAVVADLWQVLEAELSVKHASSIMRDVELPLASVLGEMERIGIAVDVPYLEQLSADFEAEVNRAAESAYGHIGAEVNLGSPKQLQQVLFEQLGMPKTKKTKTGYTTDASALTELFAKTQHPFLAELLRHRDQIKLKQTVDGLLKAVGPDNRIHTTFKQTVAATGRLSSTEPNLQNVPIRSQAGQQIRKAFIAGPGFETLITADYSQIEMRIMAHFSGDTDLIAAFESGEDLHRYVGSRVFSVTPAEVTPEMRTKVKAMSYGLAYGLSAFGLSGQLGITPTEAQKLMDDYFERFGGVRDYLESVVHAARRSGYTETILGRRRYFPDLNSDNRQRRAIAERMALNAPIQGSAADVIKLAMLGVRHSITEAGLKSRELLQVHDELVLEVAPGEVEQTREILAHQMGIAYPLQVPLEVSVGIGKNWFDAGH